MCSPNMGKVLATQLAISLARSFSLDQFILKRDYVVVIQALNHPNSYFD
jgi:hypothetical protein